MAKDWRVPTNILGKRTHTVTQSRGALDGAQLPVTGFPSPQIAVLTQCLENMEAIK